MLSELIQTVKITELLGFLATIAAFVGTIKILLGATKKGQEKLLKPVMEKCGDLENNLKSNKAEFTELLLECKRMEILLLINTQPDKIDVIGKVYDEYKNLGGNSYVDMLVESWRKSYGDDIIKRRIRGEDNQ